MRSPRPDRSTLSTSSRGHNVWFMASIFGVGLILFAVVMSVLLDPPIETDAIYTTDTVAMPAPPPVITAAAVATAPAVRMETPTTPATTTTVPSEYAPEGLSGCAEADWYAADAGLPFGAVPGAGRSGAGGFDSQPQSGVPFASYGIAFREASCDNSAHNSCCGGYFGINIGNRTAPGYRAGFIRCGVYSRADLWGPLPQQKKANACVAKVLYDVWLMGGSSWPWSL